MNPPQDTPPEAQPAPVAVAVVVIPAAVWEEVLHTLQAWRDYMGVERDTTIARLRAQDRVLGRPQTVAERRR